MRSPFLLVAGLASSGVALLPVLARELDSDTERESLDAVLAQPLDPFGAASLTETGFDSAKAEELESDAVASPET